MTDTLPWALLCIGKQKFHYFSFFPSSSSSSNVSRNNLNPPYCIPHMEVTCFGSLVTMNLVKG